MVEFLSVKCQPFTIIITAIVYTAPGAKAISNQALGGLHDGNSGLLPKHLDSFEVIGGDFNHNRFKTVLPKFKQYNDFKTRGVNMLDSWCTQTTNMRTRQAPDPT